MPYNKTVVSDKAIVFFFMGSSRGIRGTARYFGLSPNYVGSVINKYRKIKLLGFGDIKGKILFVGLAPAAHGGTRTGRVFTGDKSSDFLYKCLTA